MRAFLAFQWLCLLTAVGYCDETEPQSLYVEGYSGQVSYCAGDEVTLHVSTTAPTNALEIARLGAAREVVMAKTGVRGAAHPIPENASSHGCGCYVLKAARDGLAFALHGREVSRMFPAFKIKDWPGAAPETLTLGGEKLAAGKDFNASVREGVLLLQVFRIIKDDVSVASPGP